MNASVMQQKTRLHALTSTGASDTVAAGGGQAPPSARGAAEVAGAASAELSSFLTIS